MKKAIIVVFASIILTTLTACATAPTTEPTLKSTKVTMEPATSQTVKSDSNSLEARVQNVQYNPDTKSYPSSTIMRYNSGISSGLSCKSASMVMTTSPFAL